jgi:DNA-binding NarL/FixJ family response regulator
MKMLLADDHDLFREAISAMVSADGAVTVVPVCNLDAALASLSEDTFDLALLDYQMPGMNGLEGLDRARAAAPGVPFAVISGTTRRDLAEQVLARGAVGFIPKTLGVKAMIAAVKLMAAGEIFAPISMLDLPPSFGSLLDSLTRREREVLVGMCNGKSNKEIARDLGVQEVTVKLHAKTLTRKLSAKNRTHAAMIARSGGMMEV